MMIDLDWCAVRSTAQHQNLAARFQTSQWGYTSLAFPVHLFQSHSIQLRINIATFLESFDIKLTFLDLDLDLRHSRTKAVFVI